MANLTIAQLTELLAAGVNNADLLAIWDDSAQETKKITIPNFKTVIGAVTSVGGTSPITSTGGTTPEISISQANTSTNGYLSSSDWNTFNNKQSAISLTTTGSSGAATFIGNTLNIPNYSFSLSNWSETFSSATQATSQWTPLNAASTVNAAITPKGTGALVAQIPDGTTAGGNARGSYAVDWQMGRNNANQVASGNYSVIAGGINNQVSGNNSFVGAGASLVVSGNSSGVVSGNSNTVSGNNSFIGSGQSNTISGSGDSVIGGGNSNTASAQYSTIGGGRQNTASNTYATVAGGYLNQATGSGSAVLGGTANRALGQNSISAGGYNCLAQGQYDSVLGGEENQAGAFFGGDTHRFIGGGQLNGIQNASTQHSCIVGGRENTISAGGLYSSILGGYKTLTRLYGQVAHASGMFSSGGDAQAHELIWRREITGTAQTELFLDGGSIAAILPATNALWQGTIEIAAICTAQGNGTTPAGNSQGTTYKVTIKRIGATTTLVGTVQEIGTMNNDAGVVGSFTIDANGANQSLRIQFTPPATAGTTTVHRVVATFRGLQIQY